MNEENNEEIYKAFSIKFYNLLKNTINASVNCTVDKEDKMHIVIGRLGLEYKTSISNVSRLIDNTSEMEKEFDKLIKRYRTYVLKKYFYD